METILKISRSPLDGRWIKFRRLSALMRIACLSLLIYCNFPQPCSASSNVIKTSSVTYCSAPMAIIVDTFDVRYSKDNHSLDFDLSAASVTRGLNLAAQLELNAYGIKALNLSLDLCSVLSGVLCPLPTYNFTGSGAYAIPAANVPSIPSLAWSVPDIEAVFTIQLLDNSTQAQAACLQVTLTNGLTVGLPAVAWSSAGLLIGSALLALSAAVLAPASPLLTVPGSLFFLLGNQLQQMALAGMLSLNYPTVLRTWTTNFAYAVGLISNRPISRAIDSLRDHTGGNGFKTAQDQVAFTSRLYSPYNQLSGSVDTHTTTASSARALFALGSNRLAARDTSAQGLTSSTSNNNFVMPVVTTNTTLLDPGLAAYVNQVGFPVENAYMFLFMWLLILAAFLLGMLLVGTIFQRLTKRWRSLGSVALAVGLRVLLFVYPPLSLFTFWQWRLGHADSWVPILFSVIVWLAASGALAFVAFRLIRHYRDQKMWMWATVVGGMFKPGRWWLLGPLMLISLLRVAFIGFGQGSGQTQVISEMVLLSFQLGLLVVYRPFGATLTNVAAILQAVMALIQAGILQVMVPALGVRPIPRAVLGFIMIAVHSVGLIGVLIFGTWPLIGEIRTVMRSHGEGLQVVMREETTVKEKDVASQRSRTSLLLEPNREVISDRVEEDTLGRPGSSDSIRGDGRVKEL